MALVRVYCGLTSTDLNATPPGSVTWLTVAVVDDSGRLVDLCDISDDAMGFAELGALLADRSNGLESVGIAADSDDHIVTQLLTAAGRYLAYTDDDSAEDYAERFGDDESADEIQSSAAERRAIGLARALQAGVLSAAAQATPRDLIGLKPVLAAHAAVTTGRQGAAATLREILRELYPAALRAFPDPAEQIPLAILDALPEPGPLGNSANGRGRDAQAIAELTETGLADSATLTEAVTALRVAIAETPRRTGMNRSITSAVAETVRQSVAAVRACDGAAAALVSVLSARMPSAGAPADTRSAAATRTHATGAPAAAPAAAPQALAPTDDPARPAASRRTRSQSAAVRPRSAPPAVRPQSAPPAPAPAEPVTPPVQPTTPPVQPAAAAGAHRAGASDQPTIVQPATPQRRAAQREPAASAHPPVPVQTPPPAPVPVQTPAPTPVPVQAPPAPIPVPPPAAVPTPVHPAAQTQPSPAAVRPQPVAPVPPPGLTPAYSTMHPQPTGERSGGPTVDPLTAPPAARPFTPAASASTPAASTPIEPAARTSVPTPAMPPPVSGPPAQSFRPNGAGDLGRYAGASDLGRYAGSPSEFATGSRPAAEVPPPGSRASWPLVGETPGETADLHRTPEPRTYGSPAAEARTETIRMTDNRLADLPRRGADVAGRIEINGADVPRQREGRVVPPWQSDDLPAEPPGLRLVEPAPLADPALSGQRALQYRDEFDGELRFEPPSLRLVEANGAANGTAASNPAAPNTAERLPRRAAPRKPSTESPEPPASGESDGDLLIFAEARSAWFTDHFGEEDAKLEWAGVSDEGWRAAEQAAQPAVGADTGSGLPRRVPQQNLVPGSPLAAPDRPLRIVRDAAQIAAHTTGYFRGWRRGQEVGGYRVGGRPGRESAGWDFSRDQDGDDRDYEYRSARR